MRAPYYPTWRGSAVYFTLFVVAGSWINSGLRVCRSEKLVLLKSCPRGQAARCLFVFALHKCVWNQCSSLLTNWPVASNWNRPHIFLVSYFKQRAGDSIPWDPPSFSLRGSAHRRIRATTSSNRKNTNTILRKAATTDIKCSTTFRILSYSTTCHGTLGICQFVGTLKLAARWPRIIVMANTRIKLTDQNAVPATKNRTCISRTRPGGMGRLLIIASFSPKNFFSFAFEPVFVVTSCQNKFAIAARYSRTLLPPGALTSDTRCLVSSAQAVAFKPNSNIPVRANISNARKCISRSRFASSDIYAKNATSLLLPLLSPRADCEQ